ncbi:hypothetical protein CHLRE_07g339300v5 [Chlamydomonas reinhardtii]|uniref:Uncharacterized protein n=1 Tax=Chlamydomonas reinhardtii TaxID=3055 RepID=A8ITI2_CHLRE|nr:uncharacterized protein CHLRE_07g339300v5 [Chlamydomonas reinhardtii]PNW81016.1 hypothetical protein CHLRE_07g339300v5 [Chlamydomonas reinhardtii]|eukprot:XP_001692507.1 predicted protein [Chlamydomonas reinhardtii]
MLAAKRLSHSTRGASASRGGGRAVRTLAMSNTPSSEQPEYRPVALPSGTLWLLDSMQDAYYNVRGSHFVIPRVEERETAQESTRACRAKFVRNKSLPALRRVARAPGPSSLSLIQQAIAQQPMALTIISDGPLVDVEVDVHEEQQQQPAPAPVPSSTCTGIVHVPNSNSAEADAEETYQTSSSSPRRTKMLRFTCLADGCKAVNVKPISPEAFAKGTVFAQCAKCGKWHLIKDHLKLWDQSKRTVYRRGKRMPPPLTLEEVPEALRPAIEDLDFFANGGQVGGFEPPLPPSVL